MNNGLYRWYCIAVVSICSLVNLSSCSPTGPSVRGWGSGYSSSSNGGWSSGSGHK